MNISTSFVALAIFALLASLILSGYQSELSTPTFIICILAKLLVPTVWPAINDPESLAKWRKIVTSAPSIIHANQSVIDLTVLGRDNNDIPIRLYVSNDTSVALRPVLLWFHGGGFVVGSHKAEDTTCSTLVKNTGFLVVNVEYRLAPENKFPAAVTDVASVLAWTKSNIEKHGGDPEKIYLSGDSAVS
jgi:acetyl esterase